MVWGIGHSFGQGLEQQPLVGCNPCAGDKSAFILTVGNNVQIVDASQPWPPRWFTTTEARKGAVKTTPFDARFQNGYYTYSIMWPSLKAEQLTARTSYYLICNDKMEVVDTCNGADLPLNPHDFRMDAKGRKLVTARLDTVLDMHHATNRDSDTAVKALVDVIEILDKQNHILFRWNPVSHLGAEAMNIAYSLLVSAGIPKGYLDWSHANSVTWDWDGNIIYSFRHVGFGKIAVADGHLIWHFDCTKMPYTNGSDTLACYLQHGFEYLKHGKGQTTYVLFNNGDKEHPQSYGITFTIDDKTHQLLNVTKKMPMHDISSAGRGNYEIASDGSYLMNYGAGLFLPDSVSPAVFMEYSYQGGSPLAYSLLRAVNVYKVHRLNNTLPSRPEIKRKGDTLYTAAPAASCTWYRLTDARTVARVGNGDKYKPAAEGSYCAVVKFGVGYTVSHWYNFQIM